MSALAGVHYFYTFMDLFEISVFDKYQEYIFIQVRCCVLALNASVNPMIYFIVNRHLQTRSQNVSYGTMLQE